MRKTLLFFVALLFMAVPAMGVPTVTLTCTAGSGPDCNVITVSYAVTGSTHLVRAFALDINVSDDANIVDVCALDPNYRIYPGQIDIDAVEGEVSDYGTPYALSDLGDANVTVEMGSLYTTDANYASDTNAGFNKIPGLSGDLLKFRVKSECNYNVAENALRGGVVMEDPYEVPTVVLCSGHIPPCAVDEFDFGDAPQTYSTKLADVPPGPSHLITAGPILGVLIDAEADGQPIPACFGDDNTGLADEDGITNLVAVVNEGGSVTVTVSAACKIDAWIDWNLDGSFATAGDKLVFNEGSNLGVGANALTFAVPAGATKNTPLVSRWRVSTAGGLDYYGGPASNGEVEDYNKPTVVCHVPDVVNMELDDAEDLIEAQGLDVGTITYECNSVIADGNVLRTDPVYCNYPDCDAEVDIVVSLNPALPGAASNPSPVHLATCVSVDANLSWTAGSGATSHDVYFGTDSTPDETEFKGNQPGTTYDPPGSMAVNTTYYWQIDELNACGGKTTGTVWRFTTAPAKPVKATLVSPTPSGVTNVYLYTDLKWTAGSGATSHNVYYGTENPPPFVVNQTSTTFDCNSSNQTLYNTTYYWRIDEVNACSGTTTGDLWNFTTATTCLVQASTSATHWNDWVAWGKPACWCFSRQCRGDINGKKTGTYVSNADFTILMSALGLADANVAAIPNGICADLNQKKTGTRVSNSDFTILMSYLGLPDVNVTECPKNWDGAGNGDDFVWWALP